MSQIPGAQSNKPKRIFQYDLIPNGDYPARIARFTGLGTHPQPAFQGQAKDPAFKSSFAFELIGLDTSGFIIENAGTDEETKTAMDAKPACQFADYFMFPGAKRGKVFDLCNILEPGIVKVPNEMTWFEKHLGSIVSITVGKYEVKNGPNKGTFRNTIKGVGAIPSMFKDQVGQPRAETNFFDPYADSVEMFASYSNLYKFQREVLTEALDSQYIVYAGKEPSAPEEKEQAAPKEAEKVDSPTPALDFDEDIPF
jgi:hypothetical protein